MEKEIKAQQLIAGPITDSSQLLLALVINQLAGDDGWLYGYHKTIWRAARMTERTFRARLKEMKAQGYLEDQKKPFPGLRLTDKPLQISQGDRQISQGDLQISQGDLQISQASESPAMQISQGDLQISQGDRQISQVENASTYLPKRSKDLKEVEEKEIAPPPPPPPPPPPAELVLVADNPSPENTPRLDQPAAQPPAVVEQADLLPVPAKPKRKTPRKNPRAQITKDWQPKEDTLAGLEARNGIPRAFSEACVWEFITHWMGDGDARPGWDSTFINSVKYSWKKEQDNEQNAEQRQRYTDASGRRISESTVVMQDIHDNVLANAHVFADIDEDKPF